MYDVGFIEKYGTGIYMMKELCNEYGTPKPEYEISEWETKLIFRAGGKAVILSDIEKLGIEFDVLVYENLLTIIVVYVIISYMKLSDYARKIGISYRTAWRWYKSGQLKGYQAETGTIIITEPLPDVITPALEWKYAVADDCLIEESCNLHSCFCFREQG